VRSKVVVEQVAELRQALAEAEKQAEGERGAHAALWDKLQEANERLAARATEDGELQRKLGVLEYGRQMAEGRCDMLAAQLQGREQQLHAARSRLQVGLLV
jgi:chromosome segregation ATPase